MLALFSVGYLVGALVAGRLTKGPLGPLMLGANLIGAVAIAMFALSDQPVVQGAAVFVGGASPGPVADPVHHAPAHHHARPAAGPGERIGESRRARASAGGAVPGRSRARRVRWQRHAGRHGDARPSSPGCSRCHRRCAMHGRRAVRSWWRAARSAAVRPGGCRRLRAVAADRGGGPAIRRHDDRAGVSDGAAPPSRA